MMTCPLHIAPHNMQNKATPYQKWLFMQSKGHPVALANLIVQEVMQQNRAAFELLEMTGDKEYTAETMIKAAKILCDLCGEWTPEYTIFAKKS
jgi:hypothetical protein